MISTPVDGMSPLLTGAGKADRADAGRTRMSAISMILPRGWTIWWLCLINGVPVIQGRMS